MNCMLVCMSKKISNCICQHHIKKLLFNRVMRSAPQVPCHKCEILFIVIAFRPNIPSLAIQQLLKSFKFHLIFLSVCKQTIRFEWLCGLVIVIHGRVPVDKQQTANRYWNWISLQNPIILNNFSLKLVFLPSCSEHEIQRILLYLSSTMDSET